MLDTQVSQAVHRQVALSKAGGRSAVPHQGHNRQAGGDLVNLDVGPATSIRLDEAIGLNLARCQYIIDGLDLAAIALVCYGAQLTDGRPGDSNYTEKYQAPSAFK